MADQLRFDALGCYGNCEIHTPNIDRIALNGCTFDNHYIQNPVCSPSRASIFTGRYPKNHGVRENGIPLKASEITLPEVLRKNGYTTAVAGKVHFTPQFTPKQREEEDWPEGKYGFNITHTSCDTKTGEYLDWLKKESPENYAIVKKQGERKMQEDKASPADKDMSGPPQLFPSKVDPLFHQTTWIADQTIQLIDELSGDKPFFISCSFLDPHQPFDPPEQYYNMYDPDRLSPPDAIDGELDDKPPHYRLHRTGHGYSIEKYDFRLIQPRDWRCIKAAYYGMVTLIDENVGRILNALEQKGIERDTLVMFTNDHGELLGDHGLLFKGPFFYDCMIKAPMLISWPGMVPQGSRYRQVTEHVDIMPTLLDYAGVAIPYGVQGASMAPVMRGDMGSSRKYAMTEFNCYDWGLSLKALSGRDYKLVYYAGETYGELYDHNLDPGEHVNQWDNPDYAEVKQRLLKQLMDRMAETEDTLPLRIGKF